MQPINAPSVRNYNNTGTRNNGFQYKLMPLSFNLQQKGNSNTNLYTDNRDKFNIGDIVSGICLYDYKEHTGYITQILYDEKTNKPLTVYVMDYKTKFNLPLNYSTLEKEYKNNIYESYNFDDSIKQKKKFNRAKYNRMLVKGLFDDNIFDRDEYDQDVNVGQIHFNNKIGDIIYNNKQPYAICCGLKTNFDDTFDRFLLLNHIGYDMWSLDFEKISQFKNIYSDETTLTNKSNMILVDNEGYENTQIIKNNYNLTDFPAFEYCCNFGDNVYLPAIDELEYLYFNLNDILTKLNNNTSSTYMIPEMKQNKRILSSSQTSKYTNYIIDFNYGTVKDLQKDKLGMIIPFIRY